LSRRRHRPGEPGHGLAPAAGYLNTPAGEGRRRPENRTVISPGGLLDPAERFIGQKEGNQFPSAGNTRGFSGEKANVIARVDQF